MAKSKKRKPSFDGATAGEPAADTGWVYRSDSAAGTDRALPVAAAAPGVTDESPVYEVTPAAPIAPEVIAPAANPPAPIAPATITPATTSMVTVAPAAVSAPADPGARAGQIVDRHAAYAAAASLVPIPWLDIAAISAIQLAMVRALAAHYQVPFARERGKVVVSALLGGVLPVASGPGVVTFMLKRVPVVGTMFALATAPALAGGVTYAVGQAFTSHFESGGTLDDVDVKRWRATLPHAAGRR
jgi:uncharacterized protein (DUF697 family)